MKSSCLLIIFIKNPEKGKVKTRLAETVGAEKALEIYHKLVDYTYSVVEPVDADKEIWFSRFIPDGNGLGGGKFSKKLQEGKNLGERMSKAFREAFEKDYEKVVIVGSDCAELTTDLIKEAYEQLDEHGLVVGPAEDGGYYLLGMNRFHAQLFEGLPWSTAGVLSQTLAIADELSLKVHLLPELNDVDYEADWIQVKDRL